MKREQTISKSDFAAEVGVSRARVSVYAKKGLPVRPDGLLDASAARKWFKAYVEPRRVRYGGRLRNNGVAAVEHPQPIIEFVGELLAPDISGFVAKAALAFDCTMQQAVAMHVWFGSFLRYQVEPTQLRTNPQPDWRAIAEEFGVTEQLQIDEWRKWAQGIIAAKELA